MVEELQEAVLRSQVDAQDAAGRLIDHVLGAIGGDVGAQLAVHSPGHAKRRAERAVGLNAGVAESGTALRPSRRLGGASFWRGVARRRPGSRCPHGSLSGQCPACRSGCGASSLVAAEPSAPGRCAGKFQGCSRRRKSYWTGAGAFRDGSAASGRVASAVARRAGRSRWPLIHQKQNTIRITATPANSAVSSHWKGQYRLGG